jgi:DNA-binding NarL/FixJ family response regulator
MRLIWSNVTIENMHQTVLIVDDSVGFRSQARELVIAAGFTVVGEADTCESAVRAARELTPSLVLLDIQLPDGSGFDVARRIQNRPDAPGIVLISSRDASDYGSRVARSGTLGFISKSELSARTLSAAIGGMAP